MTLPDGWFSSSDSASLEHELTRELAAEHPLYGVAVRAVARRGDCDDVLFRSALDDWVVVHLTWRRTRETLPWPIVVWRGSAHSMDAFAIWSDGYYDANA